QRHVAALIDRIVDRLYTRDASTTYVHLVYASGRRSSLYLADLTSGAMLRNIVDRAKKLAIKDIVHGTGRGLTTDDFLDAVDAEFAENTDLPNTSNPQEWARLTGGRGERVVEVSIPHRPEDRRPRTPPPQRSLPGASSAPRSGSGWSPWASRGSARSSPPPRWSRLTPIPARPPAVPTRPGGTTAPSARCATPAASTWVWPARTTP